MCIDSGVKVGTRLEVLHAFSASFCQQYQSMHENAPAVLQGGMAIKMADVWFVMC